MKIYSNSKVFNLFQYQKESDFEDDIVKNSKKFFGSKSIYIDAKKKIDSKSLGKSIPDGYLFDLSDLKNPEFYIVEVELSKHDFYNHIFPQITKFFGFFKNYVGQNELVEKIFNYINQENEIKIEFKKHLGDMELYKFLKDTINNSQNILLVIDNEKKEIPEIRETYVDTWGKMLKLILLNKYTFQDEIIFTMNPDFENIEYVNLEEDKVSEEEEIILSEDYHFDGVSENVREIYLELKDYILKENPTINFNPQKYFISIRKDKNLAFFILGRKKIRLVVLYSFDKTKEIIKENSIKELSEGVQKFWNGPSCAVIIENDSYLDEIKKLLKILISA